MPIVSARQLAVLFNLDDEGLAFLGDDLDVAFGTYRFPDAETVVFAHNNGLIQTTTAFEYAFPLTDFIWPIHAHTGRFGVVDVIPIGDMPHPVELKEIKAEPACKDMVLVNNSRLSIQPVSEKEWKTVCKMGGLN